MDYDERAICYFLKGCAGEFVSPRIISRRVGGKQRCLDDPQWVTPVLNALLDKGMVEVDPQGRYRLKRADPAEDARRKWVSPQVRRLLEKSRKDFSKVLKEELSDNDILG